MKFSWGESGFKLHWANYRIKLSPNTIHQYKQKVVFHPPLKIIRKWKAPVKRGNKRCSESWRDRLTNKYTIPGAGWEEGVEKREQYVVLFPQLRGTLWPAKGFTYCLPLRTNQINSFSFGTQLRTESLNLSLLTSECSGKESFWM